MLLTPSPKRKVNIMDTLKGYKTNLAAIGLLCLAFYEFTQGHMDVAMQSLMGALAAFGLWQAISNGTQEKKN